MLSELKNREKMKNIIIVIRKPVGTFHRNQIFLLVFQINQPLQSYNAKCRESKNLLKIASIEICKQYVY